MNILIIGGMHGNEPLGQELVAMFERKPVDNVAVLLANPMAIAVNQRYTGEDLNRSFPGDLNSDMYETKRAAELLDIAKKYDVVFDFHNTHCPENDCGFVGDTASDTLLDISSWLGLKKVIVADYECINKYAPNCLSVEISLDSDRMNALDWYERISELTKLDDVPVSDDVEKYRFVYRMTLEDKKRFELDKRALYAFKPIDDDLAALLNVKTPAYPIFVNDAYTPYNFGGILNDY